MSSNPEEQTGGDEPVQLHQVACDNITFIRETMELSRSFTAVPGWGTVLMGVMGLVGAYVASLRLDPFWWLETWVAVAFLGCATGLVTLLFKAWRVKASVVRGAGRRFAMSLAPPILAGCVFTEMLFDRSLDHLMPGTWLLLYGVGVFAGGTFSVRVVPLMGVCFMLLGTILLNLAGIVSIAGGLPGIGYLDPTTTVLGTMTVADLFLALGFGGLHLVFGVIIATKYGG